MSVFDPEHNGGYAAEKGCATDPKTASDSPPSEPRASPEGPQDEGMQPETSSQTFPPLRPRELQARALFDELWEEWIEHARDVAESHYGFHSTHADSDLERVFLVALMFIRPDFTCIGYGGPLDLNQQVVLRPQHQCGPYRIDFAVIVPRIGVYGEEIRIAVECDGHYFHDRTAKKAEKDKQRDRFLSLNGWRVMRFSETEVIRDPRACARQVEEMIEVVIEQQYQTSRLLREAEGAA